VSDSHREDIWQRGNARKIIKEAKKRFRESERAGDYAGASTAYASTRYSLAKRYLAPAPLWLRPLAVWNMLVAIYHARRVSDGLMPRTFDQVDVVSRILSKAPSWLGGDKQTAKALIVNVFNYIPVNEPQDEMLPHTRALMLVTLGEIELALGKKLDDYEPFKAYEAAKALKSSILAESDKQLAERQWCRVIAACGFYWVDLATYLDRVKKGRADTSHLHRTGWLDVHEALGIAQRTSADQCAKIVVEMHRRRMSEFPGM
jgi:hypothetical protein